MNRSWIVAVGGLAALAAAVVHAQRGAGPADRPSVTVKGRTYTPASISLATWARLRIRKRRFHRTGSSATYYVGTRTLSSFLIVTPQGHILIDSTYERNVPTIKRSVEQLGVKFADIRILLGNHAHGDHQEGDAAVKALTGATVMVMAEDVPALKAMMPGGKSIRSTESCTTATRSRSEDHAGRASHGRPHARSDHPRRT
jgi:metallo-beta-lactamase class B